MDTVWKYELRGESEQRISMPVGAQILTAQMQHGAPKLWAQVNPDNAPVERLIYIVPTGGNVPDGAVYVATLLVADGDYVFHVYAQASS